MNILILESYEKTFVYGCGYDLWTLLNDPGWILPSFGSRNKINIQIILSLIENQRNLEKDFMSDC